MTGKSYVDSVIHIFRIIIFNFSIRFIWINVMYIIRNFLLHNNFNFTIPLGKHCVITKIAFIWSLIFVCSVFIEHDFISSFIFIINYTFILSGVISIHLRFFLTY